MAVKPRRHMERRMTLRRILRSKEAWAKLGCGKTKFEEDYRFHSDDKPNVPGTDIPRVKEIPLGDRFIGFLEHEVDALIDALAKRRDTVSVGTLRPRTAIGAEGRRKATERGQVKTARRGAKPVAVE
jgi:predicted DNA-binding transcriptional regulator AlpA